MILEFGVKVTLNYTQNETMRYGTLFIMKRQTLLCKFHAIPYDLLKTIVFALIDTLLTAKFVYS